MDRNTQHACTLIDRFSTVEKIFMRSAWLGFMAVAFIAIARQDIIWALGYAAWGGIGFMLVVLPGICAHCPYPSQLDSCLFMPPGLLRKYYPYRGPEISTTGKLTSIIALLGMVIIPLFWLVHDPVLLTIFLALALPVFAAFPVYYCRRCRHHGCPLNKATPDSIGTTENN